MKLYLSSYRIPRPDELFQLVGKAAQDVKLAIIPNAKDYYAKRAKDYKLREIISYQNERGINNQEVVDLLDHRNSEELYDILRHFDVVWAVGGNTFCLRQEMRRSGFEEILPKLLKEGVVYGGDSAGAVVVGTSLRGIESADVPEFTEEVIYDGLSIVPYVLLPHADNEYFRAANDETKRIHKDDDIIMLTDAEAIIFDGTNKKYVQANRSEI